MEQGWISLWRQLQESWLWEDKPFAKGQAWVDLLLTANHENRKFPVGNELILCERGSMITSIRKLGQRWGWSNTKVRSFLSQLEFDKMIVQKKDTKKTVISIVKYSVYQDSKDTKTSQKEHENDDETTQKHTNNNVNNDNNDNKKNVSRFTPPTLEEVRAYCLERKNNVDPEKWWNFYNAKNWMIGKTKMSNWKSAVITWEEGSKGKQQKQSTNKFNSFPQREYTKEDYEELERKLAEQIF